MTGNSTSTDDKFKKTVQVVGSEHGTEGNVNDALFKERTPLDNVVPNRSAAESIERQVEEKGRVPDKPDDRQLDDMDEMNNKLSGRPGFKH